MNKIEKKRKRLKEQIQKLQSELNNSLTNKDSNAAEINVAEYMNRIVKLQIELNSLK